MEWLWPRLKRILQVSLSYLRALARLVIWTILFFFTGLQRTLFMRSEVSSAELRVIPLMCDIEDTDDKLAYIDKLCIENPDLVVLAEEEQEGIEFHDEHFDDDEGLEGE